MELYVQEDLHLENTKTIISKEDFQILTGKDRSFLEKRKGKSIFIERRNGHLYFYDKLFIVGEVYIRNKKKYKCIYNNNKAILISKTSDVLVPTTPLKYSIAN